MDAWAGAEKLNKACSDITGKDWDELPGTNNPVESINRQSVLYGAKSILLELPTVSTPILNMENGSELGSSLIPAVGQFIGSSNTDNSKLKYLAHVSIATTYIAAT